MDSAWRRIARIVRAEIGHLRRSVAGTFRHAGPDERYAPPPMTPPPSPGAPGPAATPDDVRLAFVALELPPSADTEEIRHAYRRLMSRYHPDRHARDPEREAVATELSRKLGDAYRRALAWRESAPAAPPRR